MLAAVAALWVQAQTLEFDSGVVVSDSAIASQVGADILRRGGNAVDASVAVGFALAVTHPAAGNIGGGGFMVLRLVDGTTAALDFREVAPGASREDMYKDNPRDSLVGYRAAGVPGTVAGLEAVHQRYGKLPWKEVVEPSVRLAIRGFAVPGGLAGSLRRNAAAFAEFPASAAQFTRNGKFYEAGETMTQVELGATLSRIRDEGATEFYQGTTAQRIAACSPITLADLKGYRPVWREPLKTEFHGTEVVTMPPPSSGGVALFQMLGMLRGDHLAALEWNAAPYLHLLVESMKRAFADRSEHLADPDFESVPTAELLSDDYLAKRRAGFGERATPAAQIQPWRPQHRESEETTHYSVVDREGNAVSTTYTLNGSFGSFAVVPGGGFLLNNEMDDFTTQPGKPNLFGLIQGQKNRVVAGKRPLSSMTPSIALRGGKVVLVWGSPGGPTIINTVLQVFLATQVMGKDVQTAVAGPRVHHQWLPDEVRYDRLPSHTIAAMSKLGHVFQAAENRFGSCHAIAIDPRSGKRTAGVDPRISTSGAAGY